MTSDTKALHIVLLITVMINMGISLLVPVMPILMKTYSFSNMNLSMAFLALILGRFIFQNLSGYVLIRFLPIRIIQWSLLAYTGIMALYPLASSRELFILFRFLEGSFEGTVIVVLHYLVIRLTSQENRRKMTGRFSACFGLGFILGPAVGAGLYTGFGMTGMFLGVAALGLIGFLGTVAISDKMTFLICNKETDQPETKPITLMEKIINNFTSILCFLPAYAPLLLKRSLFLSLIMIMPLFLKDRFGLDHWETGLVFTVSGILSTFTQFASGYVCSRFSLNKLLFFSLLTMCVLFIAFGFQYTTLFFLILFGLETVAFGIMLPTALSVFYDFIEHTNEKGRIVGTLGGFTDILTLLVPFIVIPLYHFSAAMVWAFLGVACLVVALPCLYWIHVGHLPYSNYHNKLGTILERN